MPATLATTEEQIYTALRTFLTTILPSSVTIIRAQQNRTSEPQGDFVVMTSMFRNRLATDLEGYADCSFTGSISGNTLTVANMLLGSISVGATMFGVGIASGTTITAAGTGTGGAGTYQVSLGQTIAEAKLACGSASFTQSTQVTVQLDVHGPNAPDNAEIISTLMRSGYAADQFAASGLPVSPLHADDPKQVPFVNASQQYEYRWVVTALLQADQAAIVPQDYADQIVVQIEPPVDSLS